MLHAQLCQGFKSSVLDAPFFPLLYGFPRSQALRPSGADAAEDEENVIDPSAPPNDNDGAPGPNGSSGGGVGSVPPRSPLDVLANGFASTSAERSALKSAGMRYPPKLPPYVGVGSGSQDGPSLAPNDSTGGREVDAKGLGDEEAKGEVGPRVPSDVMFASSGSGMLFRDSDRDSADDKSPRAPMLGPASGGSSSRGTCGRFSEGRALGVAAAGELARGGGGADSERMGGECTGRDGREDGCGAETFVLGMWSDSFRTSLMAAKSKPACVGISEAPRSPSWPPAGDLGVDWG